MNIYLLSFLIVFINFSLTFGQSKFNIGFKVGYGKGYCFNQGAGCVAPISPIPPIPTVNENINSYSDGYNRGFKMGLEAVRKSNSQTIATRQRYQTSDRNYVDDFVYNPDATYTNPRVLKKVANELINVNKLSLKCLDDEKFDEAISYSNRYIQLARKYKFRPNPAPYSIKAIAYIEKSEFLSAYNHIMAALQLGYDDELTLLVITTAVDRYLKRSMKNSDFFEVKRFCENVWDGDYYTNYFLALSNYYIGNYDDAVRFFEITKSSGAEGYFRGNSSSKIDAFKKVTNYDYSQTMESANKYLNAIKNKEIIPNPFK